MFFTRYLQKGINSTLKSPQSLLLLGPRQTGKSTLINTVLKEKKEKVIEFKLQSLGTFQQVIENPTIISKTVKAEIESNPVVLFIDEVQKIPILLDDCQYLIDEFKHKLKIILTGSSARKLRAKGVNLLPGRVIVDYIHPLIIPEIINQEEQKIVPVKIKEQKDILKHSSIEEILTFGMLPLIFQNQTNKPKLLQSYVTSYLQEEIKQEAITRNLTSFSRFLELSAVESNNVINFTHISQESGIPVSTVKSYFQILEDTLITFTIPPFIRKKRKQILSTPKYLYFDIGVRNAAAKMNLTTKSINKEIAGKLFEHFILLELINRIQYSFPHWKYYYWRTNHGLEVDFIIEKEEEIIPIEIKYTNNPQKKHIKHLEIFMEEYGIKKGYLVGVFSRFQKLTDKIYAVPWHMI